MYDDNEKEKGILPNNDSLTDIRQGLKKRVYKMANDRPVESEGEESTNIQGEEKKNHSKATIIAYNKRSEQLLSRYLRERGFGDEFGLNDISLIDFANWSISLKPSLKASSWRSYRRALLYMFSHTELSDESEEAIRILENDIYNRIRDGGRLFSAQETKKENTSTSSLKMKRVVYADYLKIERALRVKFRSSRSMSLRRWIEAGLLTGLRPSEWAATDVVHIKDISNDTVKTYLLVINAKATNGRANGVVRTLDISNFSDESKKAISDMSKLGRNWFKQGIFDYEKRECGRLLHRVSRELWSKRKNHYSLYSFRHQAIANWKTSLDQYSVAALAGHGVITTAGNSYAKKRSGWKENKLKSIPEAVPEEVNQIIRRYEYQNERNLDKNNDKIIIKESEQNFKI